MNTKILPLKILVVGSISLFYLMGRLFMLEESVGSHSIIDFVFGYFSSYFCFLSMPSIVFFVFFFVSTFLWKIQHQAPFFSVSQGNFSSLRNSFHFDLIFQFYLEILPQFVFQEFPIKQSC